MDGSQNVWAKSAWNLIGGNKEKKGKKGKKYPQGVDTRELSRRDPNKADPDSLSGVKGESGNLGKVQLETKGESGPHSTGPFGNSTGFTPSPEGDGSNRKNPQFGGASKARISLKKKRNEKGKGTSRAPPKQLGGEVKEPSRGKTYPEVQVIEKINGESNHKK